CGWVGSPVPCGCQAGRPGGAGLRRRGAQEQPPYSAGAFRFELRFSPRHPLVPPHVTLRTPIRHPAVGADGRVCQPLTSPERWAPHVTALQGACAAAGGSPRARPRPR
ncbi:UBC84 enzyme, partial [Nothoprocta ornata]|nr:UBC84 enzyme [Nothoprocta ornata]